MNRRIENLITRASEAGPKTLQGKQVVRMNAFQHGLTGQSIMMTAAELPFYQSLARGFTERFQPEDVYETQLLQKIIDTNWRLNACAALDCNLTATGTAESIVNSVEDDRTGSVFARCCAWINASDQFEKLGRYETGLNRRLLNMVAELERVQNARHDRDAREESDVQASFDSLAPLRQAVQSLKEADAASTAGEEAAPEEEPDSDVAVTIGF